jgi:hypothetical protein
MNAHVVLSGCLLRRCGASQFFDRSDKPAMFVAIGLEIRVGRSFHSPHSGTAFFNDKTVLVNETPLPSSEIFFEASESLVGSTEGNKTTDWDVLRGHHRDHIERRRWTRHRMRECRMLGEARARRQQIASEGLICAAAARIDEHRGIADSAPGLVPPACEELAVATVGRDEVSATAGRLLVSTQQEVVENFVGLVHGLVSFIFE